MRYKPSVKRKLLLAVALAAAALPAARTLTYWFSMRSPELQGVDFTRYYASALQGLRFGWHRLYDLEAQKAVAHQLGDLFWMPNVYTPAMSLVAAPFTLLSIDAAFLLWSALMLASLVACWH